MNFVKKYYAAFSTLIVFIVYLFTLAPSVTQIDAGELASVQFTLGIAHPTGYPLFTILGYLFLKLPLPITKILQANLLAAIWCSLAFYLFIKAISFLLNKIEFKNSHPTKKKKEKETLFTIDNDLKIISVISGGFFLAFSKTFWMQSTSVEVYSLQTFLFMIIIIASLKSYFTNNTTITSWFIVGFSFALGFANHMTTLLVIPFPAILFFFKENFTINAFKKIILTTIASLPILAALYLYLPIRAFFNPVINWGNPINFENFWRHFTGKQYQVWLFASVDAAKRQLSNFINNFPGEFAYIGLILGIVGLVFLFKKNKIFFYTTFITFLFSILYSINYDIVDLDSYFLLTYIIFSIWITFGFIQVYYFLRAKELKKELILGIIAISTFFPLIINKSAVDQSDVFTFEDYTKTILNSVENNSIILSYQWDYFVSASYYFQQVENLKHDVTIIDKELLRRSWYYNQLKRNHPDVYASIEPEINSFISSVITFERNENYDANLLERNYQKIMTNLFKNNIDKKNCYLGMELFQTEMQRGEFSLPKNFHIVPVNLLFKVVKDTNYVPAPDPNFSIRIPKLKNKYTEFIQNAVAAMLTYRASYELQYDKIDKARIFLHKVKKDFPEYQIPSYILEKAGI